MPAKASKNQPERYTKSRRPKPKDRREAEEMIKLNGEAYVASIMDPFTNRGFRIPDPSPFPSTAGSSVMRFSMTAIADAKAGSTLAVAGACFTTMPNATGQWYNHITAYNTGLPNPVTWAAVNHPHTGTFGTNFALIRTVSMGVRIVNVGQLLKRGGAIRCSWTTQGPSGIILQELKLSDETVTYDAGTMPEKGIEMHYIPLTHGPVSLSGGANAGKMAMNGTVYVNPLQDLGVYGTFYYDTCLYVWVEATTNETLDIEFEQVHNWEAIPWPQTEYLFDRKAVVGSEEGNALARETAGTSSLSSRMMTDGKEFSTTYKSLKRATASGLESVGHKVLATGLRQLESFALRSLSMLPSLLLGAEDYKKHVIACVARRYECSPVNDRKMRDVRLPEFIKRVFTQVHSEGDDQSPKAGSDGVSSSSCPFGSPKY